MKKWYTNIFIGVLSVWAVTACSDMNDLHDIYLQNGETIYTAKFDSIKLYPGRYRMRVDYWVTDPKAEKCQVEWNMGAESTTVDITNTTGTVPNSFYIDNLEETTISFDFNTCTADLEYPSLKTNVTTTIYGDKYASTLLNANISHFEYDRAERTLTFYWSANYDNVVGYMIRYTDTEGVEQELRAEVNSDKEAILPNFKEGGSLTYATIYLPIEGAIDEFLTPYSEPFSTADDANTIPSAEEYILQASMQADASLVGQDWSAINNYMKQYNWDYTENSNNASKEPNEAGFVDHIDGIHCEVVEDKTLNQYVFKFNNHANADVADGDRGKYEDRQRNEMKSRTGDGRYHMNGNWDEWQRLEWKFKIPKDFRPSGSFTHIHQLKAQEGNNGSPLITITPRANSNGSNRRVQVIHTGDTNETTLKTIIDNLPLEDFEDEWIQVTTVMHYTHNGYFYIKMERISDGKVLAEEEFTDIDLWRKGARDIRNKFGIYRSFGRDMTGPDDRPDNGIKDESLYLADFKIYETNTNSSPEVHD